MKKIILILLSCVLVFLCGCGEAANSEILITTPNVTTKSTITNPTTLSTTSTSHTHQDDATLSQTEKRGDNYNNVKPVSDEPEWIDILCPLCYGGKNKKICSYCGGDKKIEYGGKNKSCLYCHGTPEGTEYCPLCKDKFAVTYKNYNIDKSVMTPQQLVKQIEALGDRPKQFVPCVDCSQGENLPICVLCNGTGKNCPCDFDGRMDCPTCSNGFVKNKNYDIDSAAWELAFDNLIKKCIDTSISPEEAYQDYLAVIALQNSLGIMQDAYSSFQTGNVSGGSNLSGGSTMCKRCYGTGQCPTCYGDGLFKNSYNGSQIKCTTCGSSGRCGKCN